MKIAVNGDIIDTKDIYKITDITHDSNYTSLVFKIVLLNRVDVTVNADTDCYYSYHSKFISISGEHLVGNSQDLVASSVYGEKLRKITEFRDSIIKVWSNNQSNIPQFNL